jgi:hypothetical protein
LFGEGVDHVGDVARGELFEADVAEVREDVEADVEFVALVRAGFEAAFGVLEVLGGPVLEGGAVGGAEGAFRLGFFEALEFGVDFFLGFAVDGAAGESAGAGVAGDGDDGAPEVLVFAVVDGAFAVDAFPAGAFGGSAVSDAGA